MMFKLELLRTSFGIFGLPVTNISLIIILWGCKLCVSITTDVKLSGDSSTGSKFSTTDDLATLQAFSVTCHARKNHKIIQVNRYPPLYGWVTCNTDNSAKGCPGRAGCGGFYRDRRAKFLGCLAFHLGTNWPMLWVA